MLSGTQAVSMPAFGKKMNFAWNPLRIQRRGIGQGTSVILCVVERLDHKSRRGIRIYSNIIDQFNSTVLEQVGRVDQHGEVGTVR